MAGSDDKNLTAEEMMQKAIELACAEFDQDLYYFSGPIDRAAFDEMRDRWYEQHLDRPNAGLILTTPGGDAHAAYLIARFFKRHYDKFRVYVFGYCKSAGTLLALGADDLVIGDRGELGPLDVQLSKDDELFQRNSGLDILQALNSLSATSQTAFDLHFLHLQKRSGGVITTRTAADIAASLVNGALSPIAAQIDPLKLGEGQRAINIALEYGTRLGAPKELVQGLVTGYPSHLFVIDADEALRIFPKARRPTASEVQLEFGIQLEAKHLYYPGERSSCKRISEEREEDTDNESDESPQEEEESLESGNIDAADAGA